MQTNHSIQSSRKAVSGFSIIELMVSLVIASFVILAVVGIYSGSRENYTTQDEVSKLNENVRIGMGILDRSMRQGNYKRIPITRDQNLLLVQAFSFTPVSGIAGAGTASDEIEIIYSGNSAPGTPGVPVIGPADGTIVDCVGQPISAANVSRNHFSVQMVGTTPWFGCARPNDPTITAFVPLIPDVEAFKVTYGTYSDESRTALNFTPWSGAIDPMRVVAVRLFLMFRSSAEVGAAPSSRTYQLSDQTYGPFNDRFLRTVIERTIVIRSTAM